jgi:hypothetical protein
MIATQGNTTYHWTIDEVLAMSAAPPHIWHLLVNDRIIGAGLDSYRNWGRAMMVQASRADGVEVLHALEEFKLWIPACAPYRVSYWRNSRLPTDGMRVTAASNAHGQVFRPGQEKALFDHPGTKIIDGIFLFEDQRVRYKRALEELRYQCGIHPEDTCEPNIEFALQDVRNAAEEVWFSTIDAPAEPFDGKSDIERIFSSSSYWMLRDGDKVEQRTSSPVIEARLAGVSEK